VWFDGGLWDPASREFRAAVASGLGADDQFLDLTVHEHLDFVARAHGEAEPDVVVSSVLAEMALSRVADRFPFALSQGQRRRLGLAACWVRPRRLLILDEPEQNLDVRGRAWLADKILAERAAGVAIVVACHDPELAARIADLELELEFLDDEPGVQR
jgi:ABC-type multidrug transport system ATPase subunit